MTAPKQLYVVTITHEIIIAAESEAEAEIQAKDHLYELDDPDINAQPMTHLPPEWEERSIVYGNNCTDETDRTVGDWIKLGAAPAYTKLQAKLQGKS